MRPFYQFGAPYCTAAAIGEWSLAIGLAEEGYLGGGFSKSSTAARRGMRPNSFEGALAPEPKNRGCTRLPATTTIIAERRSWPIETSRRVSRGATFSPVQPASPPEPASV